MRYIRIQYFALFLFLLWSGFTSCKTTSNTRKPVPVVKMKKQAILGSDIFVRIKVLPKGGKVTKATLLLNGKKLEELKNFDCQIKLPLESLRLGRNRVTIEALKDNGKLGVTNKEIVLFSSKKPQEIEYKVEKTFTHYQSHFTEGLEFNNGLLYESTGEHGTSGIYKIDLTTNKVVDSVSLDKEYFGEGVTLLNGNLYQLTYKKQKAFVYRDSDMKKIKEFTFPNKEGWGLTNDGESLIMSDGSSVLYFVDPSTFKETKRIEVFSNSREFTYLNELEYVKGYIYANVWTTEDIVKIDSQTGEVVAIISLTGLTNSAQISSKKTIDVMNGIAYNEKEKSLYVTGKYWPKLYKISLYEKGKRVNP
ncbi:glutaminyl-peptide cyclotransferase [Halosquirtibacter laminarini]|uniref:Glutaminyl-peptide cyclotransferase n=1 Tax=Halosquirtibacter laminarini TaxID=3374600 RepID=A0AC61NER3_9BACT|nr:glutaminyl-peptide cyclotransferase [Prolixibacteraceae bacterium]